MQLKLSFAVVAAALILAGAFAFQRHQPRVPAAAPHPAVVVSQPPALPSVQVFPPITSSDHARGAAQAKVTLIEYTDLSCLSCRQLYATLQQVVADYPDDVRWVLRHDPAVSSGNGASSQAYANAAECAGAQGSFWQYADVLERSDGQADAQDVAKAAHVKDLKAFAACVAADTYKARIDKQAQEAKATGQLNIPFTILIGPIQQTTSLPGAVPLASLKETIDSLLK
jgi:protein-disulfide isomerase